MTVLEVIELAALAMRTVKAMVDDGRAKTTAEEDAALAAAHKRLKDAGDQLDTDAGESNA